MAHKRLVSLPVLAIGLFWGASAQAQSQATTSEAATARAATAQAASTTSPASSAEAEAQVGDIIVTAQRRSESINRVPLSITAVSGDQLKAAGITQISDLSKVVSGFQAIQSPTGTPIFYLRGVGFNDPSTGARPSVTLYADEAPLPYSVMGLGSSLDLERVEVLKGPQGLLFGSNSTGGAINFIAAKPTNTFEAGADVSLGSYLTNTESGFVSGPITNWLKGRIAFEHDGGDDWQYDHVNPKRTIGQRNVNVGRLILDARPTEKLRLQFIASGGTDRSDPQQPQFVQPDFAVAVSPGLLAYPRAPRDNRATGFDSTGPVGTELRRNNWQFQTTLRADYDLFSNLTVTSLTSYAEHRERYAQDADGTDVTVGSFGERGLIRAFSQEFRFTGTLGDRVKYIAGANFENDRSDEVLTYNIAGQANGSQFSGSPLFLPPADNVPTIANSHFTSQAGFANLEYAFNRQFTVRGGLRYTSTTSDFNGCATNGAGTPGGSTIGTALSILFGFPANLVQPGACLTLNSSFRPALFVDTLPEHNISWRGGVDYKPNDHTLIYASASRGYKAGTYTAIGAVSDSALRPVPQERLTAFEVGIKTDLVPRIFHVNAAFYYYNYDDKQVGGTVNDPVFGPIQRLVRIPKSRIWGAELEATLHPFSGMTLGGTVTYVNSNVTADFNGTTQFGVVTNFKGSAFPNTPDWQAGANAEYRFAIQSSYDAYVGGNMTYRSKTNGDFLTDQRLAIESYAIFDLHVGIQNKRKGWLVEVFGRNITNQYYYTTAARQADDVFRITGMPAVFGVRASVRFH